MNKNKLGWKKIMDCANLGTCAFFKKYQSDVNMKMALEGFINRYCKGPEQGNCVRKKISKALGGPDKVPINMMPNGMPLAGTTRDGWPDEVLAVV